MASAEFKQKLDDELSDAFYKQQNMKSVDVHYVEVLSSTYIFVIIALFILVILIIIIYVKSQTHTIANSHLTGIWQDSTNTQKIIFPTTKNFVKVVCGDNLHVYNAKVEKNDISVEDYPIEGTCEPLKGKICGGKINWNLMQPWVKDL